MLLAKTNTTIAVLSEKNVRYVYEGLSPYSIKKVDTLIKHKAYGRAWQMLRRFKCTTSST